MAEIERERAGAALVFVILLMLGLLALAHGALLASLSERAGARAAVRELEVRAAAAIGLQAILTEAPMSWMDSVDVWDTWTTSGRFVGPVETFGVARRLAAESWLVEGLGRMGGGISARTMRLAWSLDPLTRVKALPAVVSVGTGAPVSVGGTVDASDPAAVQSPMRPGDCDPWVGELDAHFRMTPVSAVGNLPDSVAAPGLGLLAFEDIVSVAPLTVTGSGSPAPSEASGACLVDEPWGWGDPDQPWRACGSHLPLRAADGALRVTGGAGQAVLIVNGDLTLTGGARLSGLVITSGVLRLEGGATFEGMALAGGGLDVAPGAAIRGSGCWAVRALASQRELLGGLVPVVGAGSIGPF
jgi:hypothetical protein